MQESKGRQMNSSLLRDMNNQDQHCKPKIRPNDETSPLWLKISKYENLLVEQKMKNKIHMLEKRKLMKKINLDRFRTKNTKLKIKQLRSQVSDASEEPLQFEETSSYRNEIALSKETDCLVPADSLECNDELENDTISELSDKVQAFSCSSSEFRNADEFLMVCSPNPLEMPFFTFPDKNCIAPTTFSNEGHSLSFPMQNSQRQVAKSRPESHATSKTVFPGNEDPCVRSTQSGNHVQTTCGTDESDKKSSWNVLELQPFNVFVDTINSSFKQGNPILMGPQKFEWKNEHGRKMLSPRSEPSKQVSAWKAESLLETKMDQRLRNEHTTQDMNVEIKAQPGSCLLLPAPNTGPFRIIGTPVEAEQDHLSSTNKFICSHCGKTQTYMMEPIFQRHDNPATSQNNDDLIRFTSSSEISKGYYEKMKAYDNRHNEAECSSLLSDKVGFSSLLHKPSLHGDETDLKREHEECFSQKDAATVDHCCNEDCYKTDNNQGVYYLENTKKRPEQTSVVSIVSEKSNERQNLRLNSLETENTKQTERKTNRTLLPNKPNIKPFEESKNSEKKSAFSPEESFTNRNKQKKKRIKKKYRHLSSESLKPKREFVERRLSFNSSSEASIKQERSTVRKRSRPNTDSTSLSLFSERNDRPSSAGSRASSSDSGIGLSFQSHNVSERTNTFPIRGLSHKYVLTRNQFREAMIRMHTPKRRNFTKKSEEQLRHSFKYKTRIKQKTLITKGVKQYFQGILTVKSFVRELNIDQRTVEVFGLGSYFDRLNRGDQLSTRERMQYEWLRLASFQHYTGNGNALSLARNGFYHNPTDGPTSTRCYLCDARHSTWDYFDNIEDEHRRQFPDCRFHLNRNEESTNVSISYENSGQELRGPYGSTCNTPHNSLRSPTVVPMSGVSPPRVSSYCRYSGMLSSVRMNMHENSTTARSVREAMRSRLEPQRRGRVEGEDSDFPLSEPSLPVRATPSERALGLQLRDTRMSSDTNSSRSTVSLPEVIASSQQRTVNIGPNEHRFSFNQQVTTGTNSSTNDHQSISQIVTNGTSSLGQTQPSRSGRGRTESVTTVVIENPKCPDYSGLDIRISSFQRWPEYLTQTPNLMAEAGFFFLGEADCTRCFCCGGGLRNWEPCDDPMFEHARWFPRCEYVNKLKGEQYVAAVQRRNQQQMADQQRQLEVADKKAKKEDSETRREMQTCQICNERPVNTAFVPCGHLVTCDLCAVWLPQCPICQKKIRGTLKIYMS